MISPYYTGDSVPLKFTITDAAGAVNPSLAKVRVLLPGNRVSTEVEAAIDGNEVSYTVPGSINTLAGHYRAYFICSLAYGERTHKIEYDIKPNPER